jgi:hypothetical protein
MPIRPLTESRLVSKYDRKRSDFFEKRPVPIGRELQTVEDLLGVEQGTSSPRPPEEMGPMKNSSNGSSRETNSRESLDDLGDDRNGSCPIFEDDIKGHLLDLRGCFWRLPPARMRDHISSGMGPEDMRHSIEIDPSKPAIWEYVNPVEGSWVMMSSFSCSRVARASMGTRSDQLASVLRGSPIVMH